MQKSGGARKEDKRATFLETIMEFIRDKGDLF